MAASTTATPNPAATASQPLAQVAPKTFRDLVTSEGYRQQLAMALPKGLSADRLVRVVLTAINKTPKLLKCTKESLWESVLGCAALGLFPDSLGRAYLVPFGDKCQLIIGWRGLVDLAYRSERINSIQIRPVFAGDRFRASFGLTPTLEHEPCDNPGDLTHVYSVVHIKGAEMPTFDVMTRAEVEAVRRRSRSANDGPWVTDYVEMAKKTVFRRHAKLLPMSAEMAQALDMDGDGQDLTGSVDAAQERQRLKDDFGSAKPADAEVRQDTDPRLAEALEKAAANGLSSEAIDGLLRQHGAPAGSTAVPADQLDKCLSAMAVATRAAAEA